MRARHLADIGNWWVLSIYADHATTTPLMPEALEAMLPFLRENFGNPSSLHGWAKPARKAAMREA